MTNRLRGEIRDMLRVEQRAGGFASGGSAFRAVLDVDTSLGVFPDHFRDGPILPGICLVHAVLLAGAKTRGVDELRIRVLKNLKLTQPVRPGQRVKIEAEMTPVGGSGGFAFRGDLAIKAKLSVGDRRCAEVSLVAYAARMAKPPRRTAKPPQRKAKPPQRKAKPPRRKEPPDDTSSAKTGRIFRFRPGLAETSGRPTQPPRALQRSGCDGRDVAWQIRPTLRAGERGVGPFVRPGICRFLSRAAASSHRAVARGLLRPDRAGGRSGHRGEIDLERRRRINMEYEILKENCVLAAAGYTVQMFVDASGAAMLASPPLLERCRKRWSAGEFGPMR